MNRELSKSILTNLRDRSYKHGQVYDAISTIFDNSGIMNHVTATNVLVGLKNRTPVGSQVHEALEFILLSDGENTTDGKDVTCFNCRISHAMKSCPECGCEIARESYLPKYL